MEPRMSSAFSFFPPSGSLPAGRGPRFLGAGLLCLMLAFTLTPAQAASAEKRLAYSLKGSVEQALKANPGLEAKLLTMEKAKMDIGVAASNFLPQASLTYNLNKLDNSGGVGNSDEFSNTNWGHGMRVSLNIFSGFMHLNNVLKAMLSADMEEARHRQAKLELIANVQLQFLQLLKAREDMKTVKASRKRIATQLAAAQAFVDVGMAPYLNVLQNEVELSKVSQQEIRVANTIRNAEVMLNKYLGYDSVFTIDYRGSLAEYSGTVDYKEAEALQISLYSRPDLIMAQKSLGMAIKQSHITAGRYLPSVNVTYDNMKYHRGYKEPTPSLRDYTRSYWNLGMNVNWTFFDGGNTTFTLLGDRKLAASLRKDYEDTMQGAKAEVIRNLLDIKAARELITASRKGMTAAKESYDMANQRYMTHTGTITDLLDAQLKLTQAEEDYSLALQEFQTARVRFFFSIGKENPGLQ
jgi:outer membrane protein